MLQKLSACTTNTDLKGQWISTYKGADCILAPKVILLLLKDAFVAELTCPFPIQTFDIILFILAVGKSYGVFVLKLNYSG